MSFDQIPQLSIKASGFNERVDGDPIKGMDWTHVAAALGQVPDDGVNLVRALYLLDATAADRLKQRLLQIAATYPMTAGLRMSLVDAVLKAYAAMRPCRYCEGDGRHWHPGFWQFFNDGRQPKRTKGRWEVCKQCEGDGYDHILAASVQIEMNVSYDLWIELLVEPFQLMYDWVRETHDVAKQIVSAYLAAR